MDLRFVPEEQSFEGRCARDSAADAPADYQPPPFFATAALQHTNVKLTWDNDDEHRKRALSKRVTADQLREDDFKVAFLFFKIDLPACPGRCDWISWSLSCCGMSWLPPSCDDGFEEPE